MAYVAVKETVLRSEGGTKARKLAAEFKKIQTETDAINALPATGGTLTNGHIIVGSAGSVATDVAMSGDVTIDNTGAVTIGAGKVTLAMHSPASLDGTVCKVVAESNIIGGIPVVFEIPVTAGTNADIDITMTHKIRVLGAHVVLRGNGIGSAVFTIKNGANAITDAMAASGADQTLVRAATIDDAYYEINVSGTLRVTGSGGVSMPAALVTVSAVRVT
jgi:hypothetical protein